VTLHERLRSHSDLCHGGHDAGAILAWIDRRI
jgi:hypothetical protein